MSLHPTAGSVLHAARIYGESRPGYVAADALALDAAIDEWRTAGFPIDAGLPDDLASAEAWARGLGFTEAPSHPGRWRRGASEGGAWVLSDGNGERWWYWLLGTDDHVGWFPSSNAALIAAWKARPEAQTQPLGATLADLAGLSSTPDVLVRLARHEAALVEAANAIGALERRVEALERKP